MKISVIWAWSWWLALSDILWLNNHNVLVYARDKEKMSEINTLHTSIKYLNWKKISNNIKATNNLEEVINFSEYLLLAVPSKSITSCLNDIKWFSKHNKEYFFINAIKWLESKRTIQQIIKEYFPKNKWVVSLLWPWFAKEVIDRNITCICAVSDNKENAWLIQSIFSNSFFRIYIQTDVIWSEIYSSMKNAIAIASWIITGLWYWENTKASLITRWLKEMALVWKTMWAKDETFFWLTWLWDLILTCSSSESRNFQAWYQIGTDDSSEQFLKNNKTTVEWIATVAAIESISKEYNLELPIIHSLYQVLYENKKPSEMIQNIMLRPLTYE